MDAGWIIVVKYQGKVIRTMRDEGKETATEGSTKGGIGA